MTLLSNIHMIVILRPRSLDKRSVCVINNDILSRVRNMYKSLRKPEHNVELRTRSINGAHQMMEFTGAGERKQCNVATGKVFEVS